MAHLGNPPFIVVMGNGRTVCSAKGRSIGTLGLWLERFEHAKDQIATKFDQKFIRLWRLYLAGSIAAFNVGELQLFQVVFAHPNKNDLPWTRAHLYTGNKG